MIEPNFLIRRPFAHRGLHDASNGVVENSLSAISAAVTAGYGIELDVQISSDGQAIVFHDNTLDRLTDRRGAVHAQSAAALQGIPLTGSTDTIPTLSQVLELIAGRVPLLIEIKDQDGQMGTKTGALEKAVASDLLSYTGDVALMSFNPNAVAHFVVLCPHIPRGIVTSAYHPDAWPELDPSVCKYLRDIPDYGRVGASFISHEVSDLASPRVADLKEAGATVLCWTVKSPGQEAQARQVAQNITFEGYMAP